MLIILFKNYKYKLIFNDLKNIALTIIKHLMTKFLKRKTNSKLTIRVLRSKRNNFDIIQGTRIFDIEADLMRWTVIVDPEHPNDQSKNQIVRISPIFKPLKHISSINPEKWIDSNKKQIYEIPSVPSINQFQLDQSLQRPLEIINNMKIWK